MASLCARCGTRHDARALLPVRSLRANLAAAAAHEGLRPDALVCPRCLHVLRVRAVEQALAAERGDLSDLERRVLDRLAAGPLDAREAASPPSRGARVADRVTTFGGSWAFLGSFGLFLVVWMGTNVALLRRPFDPYPFILLNLCLSCLAAVQAPVILMSQGRQERRDRDRAEQDLQVDLRAELQVQLLREQVDFLAHHQMGRLLEIQRTQVELMEEIAGTMRDPSAQHPRTRGRRPASGLARARR